MDEDAPNTTDKTEPRVGSYRLMQQLGSGGMSSVFRAVHAETGHEVAVKILPRALAKNPTLLQRFLREAKSAESLEHPNIVSIFDRGVDQGRHYLVLEYVAGGDLHDRVKAQGPLPISEAIRVIRCVAEGLRYAASQGMVHRDIKPANLLVSPEGQVKIIDLGLALQTEGEDERVTRDGTTVGTVDYMAPEQARDSRATSERSDIYSLGCTFYYLLTGSPPFPGGDLADKLTRHCTKPAPDPRKLRLEVPEALAAIVMRMLAKRPEKRYDNYDKLIAALDACPREDPPRPAEPLFALIDDEDDESAPPAVLDALIADDSDEGIPVAPSPAGATGPVALDALIAEDSDESVPIQPPARKRDRTIASGSQIDSLPLAELAALDEDTPRSVPARAPREQTVRRPEPEPALAALIDDDEPDAPMPGRSAVAMRRFSDASAETWVKRCAVIGMTLVLLIIGVDQLIKASRGTSDAPVENAETNANPEPVPEGMAPAPMIADNRPEPPTVIKKVTKAQTPAPRPVATAWVEPGDPPREVVSEPDYGTLDTRFLPSWMAQPVAERLPGLLIGLRRTADPAAVLDKTTLRQALDVIGGTNIEIADDGPFFEDDLRLLGDSRSIRARAGFRPIICVEETNLEVARQQPAVIVLDGKDGKQLILDGLDLVVDIGQLPREQSALFLCRGANLTLRNCTITVVNPHGEPFAVIRTAPGPRPSRVRIEQSFIRGDSFTALDLAGGAADVVLSRSVLVEGGAPLVVAAASDSILENKLAVVRSLCASRAPFLETTGVPTTTRPRPLSIRALGSTFACFRGASPSTLIAGRDGAGGANEVVQWEGDQNIFAGWNAWFATGQEAAVKVADLAEARRVWTATDEKSQMHHEAWPDSSRLELCLPVHLEKLAPTRLAVLARVAAPSPFLLQKTVASFDRPVIPALAAETLAPPRLVTPAAAAPVSLPVSQSPPVPAARTKAAPGKGRSPAGPYPLPVYPGVPPKPVQQPAAPPTLAEGEFEFDTAANEWKGDLGHFLNEKARGLAPGKRIKVFVTGRGEYPFTPVRLPEGVALTIVVDEARTPRGTLSWTALPTSAGAALIDVRGGDLVLSGVVLTRDGGARLKSLVRVEHGHLVAHRCRFRAPGTVETGGGGLVTFLAPTTQRLTDALRPFQKPMNRPVCLVTESILITGGDAITSEIGAGLIALTESAIAAGHCAFALNAAKVARSRFDADLFLDHCTIASERDFFRLGPWKGSAPGPDRPWLVTSRNSAYLAQYQGGQRESVLLRTEGGALARGSLFWEGYSDAYEVLNFTASGESPPPASLRPNVQRQWVGLWGALHVQKAFGPGPGRVGNTPAVRFVEKLRPGGVAPENLVLDPNVARERRTQNIGASPAQLGLPAPALRK